VQRLDVFFHWKIRRKILVLPEKFGIAGKVWYCWKIRVLPEKSGNF
jgi:hypothetical protein